MDTSMTAFIKAVEDELGECNGFIDQDQEHTCNLKPVGVVGRAPAYSESLRQILIDNIVYELVANENATVYGTVVRELQKFRLALTEFDINDFTELVDDVTVIRSLLRSL